MDNGYGLSKDIAVVKPILEAFGYEVERVGPNRQARGKTDIAIHLEHLYQKNFDLSPVNIAVPNIEWCPSSMVTAMRKCQMILAKTQDAYDILSANGFSPILTGWTSPDVYLPGEATSKNMVHIAGRSPLKGTKVLMEAMKLIPDIPLTVYRPIGMYNVPHNVKHVRSHIPDMRPIINNAWIHVLPSQYEGFGHALNEAMCVGATIVTTDAAPMNTFGGYHAEPSAFKRQNLAILSTPSPETLANEIARAWHSTEGKDPELRREWKARDEAFNLTFTELISTL